MITNDNTVSKEKAWSRKGTFYEIFSSINPLLETILGMKIEVNYFLLNFTPLSLATNLSV